MATDTDAQTTNNKNKNNGTGHVPGRTRKAAGRKAITHDQTRRCRGEKNRFNLSVARTATTTTDMHRNNNNNNRNNGNKKKANVTI